MLFIFQFSFLVPLKGLNSDSSKSICKIVTDSVANLFQDLRYVDDTFRPSGKLKQWFSYFRSLPTLGGRGAVGEWFYSLFNPTMVLVHCLTIF